MPLNYTPFASNPYGSFADPIKFSNQFAPTSKTYHGITIEVGGNVLGRVQSWNVAGAYNRQGNHVYEMANLRWGKPVDYVPGIAEGFNIDATVAELWEKEIEIQLGLGLAQFDDLIQQTFPFTAKEFWFRGNLGQYRVWTYQGCWLTNANEEGFTADGNARVMRNFSFNYVSRQLTSSAV